jgi:hypothetical protein
MNLASARLISAESSTSARKFHNWGINRLCPALVSDRSMRASRQTPVAAHESAQA